ncbi:unnamed protein product [Onchocerca ochengi]|uniref:Protein kinase domain-containing protein n=1 Tax=Onchocerca ochengi TaxID=42157 RepID=A0A182EAP0_ONCOC|nr:unnamed protein product [Onchocerca ochengi]
MPSSEQFLLDDNCHLLKVADFNMMVHLNNDMVYRQRSASWLVLKIVAGSSPLQQSDIYSFGIILWEIIIRRRPHNGLPPYIEDAPTKLMQMIER